MRQVDLIDYLDDTELSSVKSLLDEDGILYVVKQHGGQSQRRSYYFKISVREEDLERALHVSRQINVKRQIEKNRCPKCKSGQYQKVENLNWWMRLWYSGTTPVKCKKCGRRFVI